MSKLPSLLVPSIGNHTQTVLLLALARHLKGNFHLILWATDLVADSLVRAVAEKYGIQIITERDALANRYDRVYVHGWSRTDALIEGLQSRETWIYGDGLNNRISLANNENARGVVFWGIESSVPAQVIRSKFDIMMLFVPFPEIRAIWNDIFGLSGVNRGLSTIEAHSLIICFRYWGSNSYIGVTLRDIENTLKDLAEISRYKNRVFVVPDNRWNLPKDQVGLVKQVFPSSVVRLVPPVRGLRAKLGHLANFDAFLFARELPPTEFFGFDGSPPVTVLLGQPNVEVLVTNFSPLEDSPIHQLIRDNFDYHLDLARSRRMVGEETLSQLIESKSLQSNLQGVRFTHGYSNAQFGALVRNLISAEELGDSKSEMERLLSLVHKGARASRRKQMPQVLVSKLVNSALGERVFHSLVRFSRIRTFLGRLSRMIQR